MPQYNFFVAVLINEYVVHMTAQQRLDRVLSLTTSLVTPLNLVIDGVCKSFDVRDNSIGCTGKFEFIPWADVTSDPFSDALLVRDCARCFFKLANVVPFSEWSRLCVSIFGVSVFKFWRREKEICFVKFLIHPFEKRLYSINFHFKWFCVHARFG